MHCYDYAYMRQHSVKGKCNSKFGHLEQYSLFHVVFFAKAEGQYQTAENNQQVSCRHHLDAALH